MAADSRLPPPPVQTLPQGYLGLLGIKNGGQNPQQAAQVLAPTIDMSIFYRAGARNALANSGTGALLQNAFTQVFGGAFIGPPAGKVWIVEHVCMFMNSPFGAAANARLSIMVIAQPNQLIRYASPIQGPFLTGEQPVICAPEVPLILLPGENFAIDTVAPAAITAVSALLYVTGIEINA